MIGTGVLVFPLLLGAGLVLVFLGATGAGRPNRPASGRRLRMDDWMLRAGLRRVSPVQLAAFCAGLGLLAGVVILGVSGSPWIALAFSLLASYLPAMVLRSRHRRASAELRAVWPDAIDHLASGVRAGLSLPEAVAALADDGPAPLRPAFARFADHYHATGRFFDALDGLKVELADPSGDAVVETLRVAREVGGHELGRTLRALTDTLREHERVRRELEARQSWVVVAARLAFATPWVVLGLLATRRDAAAAYARPGGAVVLAVGAVMACLGYKLMLRIGRLPREERVLR